MWVVVILSIASAVFFLLTGWWLSQKKDGVSAVACVLGILLLIISVFGWHNTGHGILRESSDLKNNGIYKVVPARPCVLLMEVGERSGRYYDFFRNPPDSTEYVIVRKSGDNIVRIEPLYSLNR